MLYQDAEVMTRLPSRRPKPCQGFRSSPLRGAATRLPQRGGEGIVGGFLPSTRQRSGCGGEGEGEGGDPRSTSFPGWFAAMLPQRATATWRTWGSPGRWRVSPPPGRARATGTTSTALGWGGGGGIPHQAGIRVYRASPWLGRHTTGRTTQPGADRAFVRSVCDEVARQSPTMSAGRSVPLLWGKSQGVAPSRFIGASNK